MQDTIGRFRTDLEAELLQLRRELQTQTYTPGAYRETTITRPKRRMIIAAPFRDRNVSNRVLPGGSWNNNANNARCANRDNNNPDNANNNIGFRCVRGIREGAGGHTCPLRAGGVCQSTDCRSVPSESPPVAACFPEYLPGNEYAGVIGAGSWKISERPDDDLRKPSLPIHALRIGTIRAPGKVAAGHRPILPSRRDRLQRAAPQISPDSIGTVSRVSKPAGRCGSNALELPTLRRFGNRRYGRFGNLRYSSVSYTPGSKH
jgi:hypothetical protein